MAKFKACPFCGCSVPPAVQGNGIGDNWLECTECGASTRLREDGAGSEKDWNRRTPRATSEQPSATDDIVCATIPKPMLMARCENRSFLVAGFESPEECRDFIYAINTAPPVSILATRASEEQSEPVAWVATAEKLIRDYGYAVRFERPLDIEFHALLNALLATRDAAPSDAPKPREVKRDSDFSVTVVFASCRLASEFERQAIAASARREKT